MCIDKALLLKRGRYRSVNHFDFRLTGCEWHTFYYCVLKLFTEKQGVTFPDEPLVMPPCYYNKGFLLCHPSIPGKTSLGE